MEGISTGCIVCGSVETTRSKKWAEGDCDGVNQALLANE